MLPIKDVIYPKYYLDDMLPIPNVTYTRCIYQKCYLDEMLPIRNVTYTRCYISEMLPR